MISCLISRAANIFPLSFLSNLKRRIKITFNMQIMIFFSGLRGAIAFGLALNINTPHSDLIITTTLSIVILTTILCGSTTKYMLDILGLNNCDNNDNDDEISETILNDNIDYHKYDENELNDNNNNDDEIEMTVMRESPSMTFRFENENGYFEVNLRENLKVFLIKSIMEYINIGIILILITCKNGLADQQIHTYNTEILVFIQTEIDQNAKSKQNR